MRRWLTNSALLGALLLLLSGDLASAQQSRDDRDRDDRNDQETPRFALAVGAGLVHPQTQTENYYMAALRIRLGTGDESGGQGGQGGQGRRDRSIEGYLEPEFGYWKSTDRVVSGKDTLFGVNLVGAFPFAVAESFLGVGVDVHSIDAQLLRNDPRLTGAQTKLGANAQFGIDLNLTRALSVFGAGRFDLVQGASQNVQSKVYLGLRARF